MAVIVLKEYREPLDRALEIANHVYDNAYNFTEDECGNIYDIIFGDKVCDVVVDEIPNFDWFDPYTTYKEDVLAFIQAFLEAAKDITYI